MKKILAIIRKDTVIRFSGLTEWLFFLILPIIFTLVIGASTGPPADFRTKVYIVDQTQNMFSETLTRILDSSTSIRTEQKPLKDAVSEFEERKISAIVLIPATFNREQLITGAAEIELRQLPNNIEAVNASNAVRAGLSQLDNLLAIARLSANEAETQPNFNFASGRAREEFFDAAFEQAYTALSAAPQRVQAVQANSEDQIEYNPATNTSAGQLITWVFIPLIGLSAYLARERKHGTLRRLLTTPTTRAIFLGSTILGQVLTALVQMLLLVLFGILVMKINFGQHPLALALILLSSALAAAAMGTLLGTFVKTEAQADGLSIMFGMVFALMGGCWYPLELFPTVVQQAVKILPTTWAMQGLLDISLRGQGVAGILPEAGVLLGFATIFFVIGILRFKYE